MYVYELQWKIIKEENYIESISRIYPRLKIVEPQLITLHILPDYLILV
jgi:hypothetical protein